MDRNLDESTKVTQTVTIFLNQITPVHAYDAELRTHKINQLFLSDLYFTCYSMNSSNF